MTAWTGFMRNLISRSVDLLGPPDARCLVCGGRRQGRPARQPDGIRLEEWLCAGCASRIPWIRRPACPRCGRPVFCPDCIRQPVRAFEMNRSAVRYTDDMKAWLAMYKFRGDERYGELLAGMITPAFARLTAEAMAGRPWHAVTYVPVSRERAEERGFNQAERLARAAAAKAGAPLLPLIRRLRDTGKQSQRNRAERLRAMRAVFGPDEAEIRRLAARTVRAGLRPGEPLRILLVDDIYTTGATAEACACAIRSAAPFPVRVYVLTWARS